MRITNTTEFAHKVREGDVKVRWSNPHYVTLELDGKTSITMTPKEYFAVVDMLKYAADEIEVLLPNILKTAMKPQDNLEETTKESSTDSDD